MAVWLRGIIFLPKLGGALVGLSLGHKYGNTCQSIREYVSVYTGIHVRLYGNTCPSSQVRVCVRVSMFVCAGEQVFLNYLLQTHYAGYWGCNKVYIFSGCDKVCIDGVACSQSRLCVPLLVCDCAHVWACVPLFFARASIISYL